MNHLQNNRNQLLSDHDRFEKMLRVEDEQRKSIETQTEKLTTERNSLLNENNKLKTHLHGQLKVDRDLKEALHVLTNQYELLQSQIRKLQGEQFQETSQLNKLKSVLNDTQAELKNSTNEYNDFVKNANYKTQELERTVLGMKEEKNCMEIKLEKANKNLNGLIEKESMVLTQLNKEVLELDEVGVHLTHSKSEKLKVEVEHSALVEQLTNFKDEILRLKTEVVELRAEHPKLKSVVDEARIAEKEILNSLNQLKIEDANARKELDQNMEFIKEEQSILSELRKKRKKLAGQCKNLESGIEKNREVFDTSSKNSKLASFNTETKEKYLVDVETKLLKITAASDKARENYSEMVDRLNSGKIELEQTLRESKDTKGRMIDMKSQCRSLEEEFVKLQAKIATGRLVHDNEKALKDRCHRLSIELQNANAALDDSRRAIDGLKRNNAVSAEVLGFHVARNCGVKEMDALTSLHNKIENMTESLQSTPR